MQQKPAEVDKPKVEASEPKVETAGDQPAHGPLISQYGFGEGFATIQEQAIKKQQEID